MTIVHATSRLPTSTPSPTRLPRPKRALPSYPSYGSTQTKTLRACSSTSRTRLSLKSPSDDSHPSKAIATIPSREQSLEASLDKALTGCPSSSRRDTASIPAIPMRTPLLLGSCDVGVHRELSISILSNTLELRLVRLAALLRDGLLHVVHAPSAS